MIHFGRHQTTMTLIVTELDFLCEALAEGIECRVEGFTGDFRFLSNFYPSPIEVDRILFPTVEHAYQAAKTSDRSQREAIAALPSPGKAKRVGSMLQPTENWERLKLGVMEALISLKFNEHVDLRQKLLATGNSYLEETNTWGDRFWGVSSGDGLNHLGLTLMKVREMLRTSTR